MMSYVSSSIEYTSGYVADFGRRKDGKRKLKRSSQSRGKKGPTGFNGIHRRRNKHWSW